MKDIIHEPLTKIQIYFQKEEQKKKYLNLIQALGTHMKQNSTLFDEAGIYLHMMVGFNLQGHKISNFSHSLIKGHPYTFEDGKTIVSQEEALEWALCDKFSPLMNGFRINPF